MSVILYKKQGGDVVFELVNPLQLDSYLKNDYHLSEDEAKSLDKDEYSDKTDEDIKNIATGLGIDFGKKGRKSIPKLIKEATKSDED